MNSKDHITQVGSESHPGTISQSCGIAIDKYPKKPECPKKPELPKEPKLPPPSPEEQYQTHVHEFQGSTMLAETGEDRHNHRFAGVSSEMIPFGNSHVHGILTNTDFFVGHHHEIAGVSGPAIEVGGGKHIHFVKFITTIDDGHSHEFQFASLIEDPLN